MTSKIPILNLPIGNTYFTQGDSFAEVVFSFGVTDQIDLMGSEIRLDLFSQNCNKSLSFVSGVNIEILSSKSFKINEIQPEETKYLDAGLHRGDLEITTSSGFKTTYLEVVLNIRKQYTK